MQASSLAPIAITPDSVVAGRVRRGARRRHELSIEQLEDRTLLSIIAGKSLEDFLGDGFSPDDVAIAGRAISLYRSPQRGNCLRTARSLLQLIDRWDRTFPERFFPRFATRSGVP
jgi:hypothetical protein